MIRVCAFETETVAAASTAQSRTDKYGEDGTQLIRRFMAKNPFTRQALIGLRKGDT